MELEFCLSNFTGLKTKNAWKALKERCEYGNNEDIVREWLPLCEIEDNNNAIFMLEIFATLIQFYLNTIYTTTIATLTIVCEILDEKRLSFVLIVIFPILS